MKNTLKSIGLAAVIAAITFIVLPLTGCPNGTTDSDGGLKTLAGNVTISPSTNVTTGTELTATYSGSETVTLTYQWKKDGANVGTNSNKHTPADAGSYTVTLSVAGYNPKTSAAVNVTGATLQELKGTITITAVGDDFTTGKELTAVYSGSESVTYQWKKGDTSVGTNSNKYTPDEAGSYTVTVSAANYNPKTSAAVTVTGAALPELAGNLTIDPSENVTTGMTLTAAYDGSETVTLAYQWKKDGTNVSTNTMSPTYYTPAEAGSYTVTIIASGYKEKTSAAVIVTPRDFGNLTIDPSEDVTTGTELTAQHDGGGGGMWGVTYQWHKDGSPIPYANLQKYTPAEAGEYTVTISATGYNSKTSAPVTVTGAALPELPGNVTISPNTNVTYGMTLTAAYSGSETVTYQWNRNGSALSDNYEEYYPQQAGIYSVTVSAAGYKSKTSADVTVELAEIPGTLTITAVDNDFTTGKELTAVYEREGGGIMMPTYQWNKNGSAIPAATGREYNTYTPLEPGSYSVTISEGPNSIRYKPKTSAAVTVTGEVRPPLAGTFAITGTLEVDYTLTADISGLNGIGTYSYLWKRGNTANTVNTDIPYIGSYQTYILQEEDIGKYIAVTVTCTSNPGSVTSAAVGPIVAARTEEITVTGTDLNAKLAWLKANAAGNRTYLVTVDKDETLAGVGSTDYNSNSYLYYLGKENITIRLEGTGGTRTISLSSNGWLFQVSPGVTLVLENNLTLQGKSGNNASVVNIGGHLIMKTGTKITGNATSADGGGVHMYGGRFTMDGGEISGNTASGNGGGVYMDNNTLGTFTMSGGDISGNTASGNGGGVYVNSSGTFTKSAGTIYGTDGGASANTAKDATSGNAVYVGSSPAKRREATAGPDVALDANVTGATGGWEE